MLPFSCGFFFFSFFLESDADTTSNISDLCSGSMMGFDAEPKLMMFDVLL